MNVILLLVRWHSQSKAEVVSKTKFDLHRNEKKVTVNKAHVMA